jgi:hypothetical protein
MEERTASIEFHGHVLQYAEVATRDGGSPTLLRLGSCDFEFDVEKALLGSSSEDQVKTISDALEEIFSKSEAAELHIALHPSVCTSFFTPIKNGNSQEELDRMIHQNVTRVCTFDEAKPPVIETEMVRSESLLNEPMNWYHVLFVENHIALRFEHLVKRLPTSSHRYFTTTRCVATVLEHASLHSDPAILQVNPYILALGWYPTHVEYTICTEDKWMFSSFNHARYPTDSVYYILSLLQRLEISPRNIGQLFVYGTYPDTQSFIPFESLFSVELAPLNPLLAFGSSHHLSNGYAAATYVPCIGAALKHS